MSGPILDIGELELALRGSMAGRGGTGDEAGGRGDRDNDEAPAHDHRHRVRA